MSLSGLANQIVLMFGLMMVGFVINKLKFLHPVTTSDLTRILLTIIGPALIITAFDTPFSVERVRLLLIGSVAMIVMYLVQIICAHLVFFKVESPNLKRTAIYGSIYSNVGFLGIPLAGSLFGKTGVFFAVIAMAIFNVFNWSHGVSLFRTGGYGSPLVMIKEILLNPNIIAIIIGLTLFLTSTHLPSTIYQAFTYVGNANTPLSMIIVGNSLGDLKINRKMINQPILIALVLRNLIFPVISIIILLFFHINGVASSVLLLMSACPVASLGVLFTLQVKGDVDPALTLMGTSTLLSLVTIPLVFALYGVIQGL
ncbi:AEC family transporter [Lacticaseibacillus pantheris]|nr:AEC family transporter [Lacticaseibacillus pantheris]WKF86171.1 AEC family transporter [Lacticaseibacillus pantheris]